MFQDIVLLNETTFQKHVLQIFLCFLCVVYYTLFFSAYCGLGSAFITEQLKTNLKTQRVTSEPPSPPPLPPQQFSWLGGKGDRLHLLLMS
jgi:hypothetical protein